MQSQLFKFKNSTTVAYSLLGFCSTLTWLLSLIKKTSKHFKNRLSMCNNLTLTSIVRQVAYEILRAPKSFPIWNLVLGYRSPLDVIASCLTVVLISLKTCRWARWVHIASGCSLCNVFLTVGLLNQSDASLLRIPSHIKMIATQIAPFGIETAREATADCCENFENAVHKTYFGMWLVHENYLKNKGIIPTVCWKQRCLHLCKQSIMHVPWHFEMRKCITPPILAC